MGEMSLQTPDRLDGDIPSFDIASSSIAAPRGAPTALSTTAFQRVNDAWRTLVVDHAAPLLLAELQKVVTGRHSLQMLGYPLHQTVLQAEIPQNEPSAGRSLEDLYSDNLASMHTNSERFRPSAAAVASNFQDPFRMEIVHWAMLALRAMKCSESVLHLAIQLLDRYYARAGPGSRESSYATTCAALCTALKFLGETSGASRVDLPHFLGHLTGNAVCPEQVFRREAEVVGVLDFSVMVPTVFDALEILLTGLCADGVDIDAQKRRWCSVLLRLSLLDTSVHYRFPDAVLAAAAVHAMTGYLCAPPQSWGHADRRQSFPVRLTPLLGWLVDDQQPHADGEPRIGDGAGTESAVIQHIEHTAEPVAQIIPAEASRITDEMWAQAVETRIFNDRLVNEAMRAGVPDTPQEADGEPKLDGVSDSQDRTDLDARRTSAADQESQAQRTVAGIEQEGDHDEAHMENALGDSVDVMSPQGTEDASESSWAICIAAEAHSEGQTSASSIDIDGDEWEPLRDSSRTRTIVTNSVIRSA